MSRRAAPAAVRWTAYVAVAIVFAIACAFLANWQFDRNAGRAEQLALVADNYDREPTELGDIIAPGDALAPTDEWRPVTLTGEYLADETLLVRNRPHGGTSAFEVLVPFRTDDGRILIVNRGWVRPGAEQPLPDEVPAPPEGEATVVVRLRPGEPLPSGRTADEGQVPTIHLPSVAAQVDSGAIEESAYGLMASESPAPATRPGVIEPPSDDPGPHLSYAVQWILFAVMGFIFIGYVIRTERQHRREEQEEAAGATGRGRPSRRRRDRDAEDEDALIDAASADGHASATRSA